MPRNRRSRTNAQKNAGTNRATETPRSMSRHLRFQQIEELIAQQRTGGEIVRIMMGRTGLQERQVAYDLAEVYERCRAEDATDHEIRLVRARRTWGETLRRCQLQAEEHLGTQVGAAYERRVIECIAQLCKLDGLYAPKKIEMSGSVNVHVGIQITKVVGVLDADGLAALSKVMEQVEAAKANGLLQDVAPLELAEVGTGRSNEP